MKILYIGDNRKRQNFGCRATSLAFGTMLLEVGEVTGSVDASSFTRIGITPIIGSNDTISKIKRRLPSFARRYSDFLSIDRTFIRESPRLTNYLFDKAANRSKLLNELRNIIEDCDLIAFNAEGSFIFSTPPPFGFFIL